MKPSIKINSANPNHHLWNNNGVWFMHYTVFPTQLTKDRVRRSLGTRKLEEARRLRDSILAQLLQTA